MIFLNKGEGRLGRRVTISTDSGIASFANSTSGGKLVGEIALEKQLQDSICNICLKNRKLTFDHVPPKCTGNKGTFEYISYYNDSLFRDRIFIGRSKDGIKYRTICSKCNNEKLKICDDAIFELYCGLRKQADSKAIYGAPLKIRPNLIIRGILGHFLAAKTFHAREAFEDLFAAAIDDLTQPISPILGFYVVPFMFDEIRVLRDIILPISQPPIILNSLKVYPLAFIVSSDRSFQNCFEKIDVPDWHGFFDIPINEYNNVPVFQTMPIPKEWPELPYFSPVGTGFGRAGSESVIGTQVSK